MSDETSIISAKPVHNGGMMRPQVSIAGLALVVLIIAIGLAAVRSGSPAWSGAMYSIMVFTLVSSLLGVTLTRGTRRIFWSGFATLGWTYVLLAHVPWLFHNVGQFLLAPHLFEAIDQALGPEMGVASMITEGFRSMGMGGPGGGAGATGRATDPAAFVRIGMALEALLWAYLGGWAARYFVSDRNRAVVTGHGA